MMTSADQPGRYRELVVDLLKIPLSFSPETEPVDYTGAQKCPTFTRWRPVGQSRRKHLKYQTDFWVVASPTGFEPVLPP
jgi:hypothetical protein